MNPRKFERDPDDKIIAGVCGGLARYFGISAKPIRFLFAISVFVSFSATFWVYVLLWVIAPLRRSTRESLSRDVRKKARQLDQLFTDTRRRASLSSLSDRLDSLQDVIETLLPEFDRRTAGNNPKIQPIHDAVFTHLPALLDNFLKHPSVEPISGGKTAQDYLAEKLQQMERTLANFTKDRYGEKFAKTADALDDISNRFEDDPTAPFRLKLESLQSRVAARLDPEATAKLESIKGSLLAAMKRLLEKGDEADPNLYNVRQIALEYLPNTVDKYLSLPQSLADNEPLSQGKTARAAFHEQLNLLDGALTRLVASLYQEDAQGLFVHGHFLRDKFLEGELELELAGSDRR